MNVSVHGARRRSLLGSLVVLALLAFAVFIPSFAQAAVPANDEIGAATAIGSLPFTDTLGTTEATTAADDPVCAGNGHTVWYTFTPSADILLDANTFGSSYDTTISVYTGSPGALTQIACNDDSAGLQSQVIFDATAGQTYYIMAGSFFSASGGSLTLTLRQATPPPPPPEVGLSIDRSGFVDQNGVATISGTVTCNQPMFVNLSGSLTQTFARRFTIEGFGGNAVSCTPLRMPGRVAIISAKDNAQCLSPLVNATGMRCGGSGERPSSASMRVCRPRAGSGRHDRRCHRGSCGCSLSHACTATVSRSTEAGGA